MMEGYRELIEDLRLYGSERGRQGFVCERSADAIEWLLKRVEELEREEEPLTPEEAERLQAIINRGIAEAYDTVIDHNAVARFLKGKMPS